MTINKIRALLIIMGLFILNSCDCFDVERLFSLRYNGGYTGIDTLINMNGYYSFPGNNNAANRVTFYNDGTLAACFFTKRSRYNSLNDKTFLRKLESGLESDSVITNSINAFGLYKIISDTIRAQVIWDHGVNGADYIDVWFKISYNKLIVIKHQKMYPVDARDMFNVSELVFYPAWRPDSSNNWLRDCLREKGRGR